MAATAPPPIHVDGAELIGLLDERGWLQGEWEDNQGRICAHQAIKLCCLVPGDFHLIEVVADRQGWGTEWNDADTTTAADVRGRLAPGIAITDSQLASVFGPRWRGAVALVRRCAVLTKDEVRRLDAAWDANWGAAREAARAAAWYAARSAARSAARDAARAAAWYAARSAARSAAREAAWDAARDAARDAAGVAAGVVVTWDLAQPGGPYRAEHRSALSAVWDEAIGPLAELVGEGV